MQGTRLDHEEVVIVDGHLIEQAVPAALLHRAGELLTILGLLAHDDLGARVGAQHIPALALAQAAVLALGRVGIVGVHPHGQVLARPES